GFGFGWELSENAEILRRLSELRVLRCPILVGMSRKRMTGEQFGWGVEQRLEGSAAVTALAVANGADLVRVHDVAEMARVVRMADDIVRQ
ncbi:MAG: dihydropteroate synthase, partial [Chloroflexi bacterium]|nr:dihydropteroate synthase [Chloroflexota bacterium]